MHPLLRAAAKGALPEWARASERRRAHMLRVADLMERWATEMGRSASEVRRWRAAAMLHDALHDADPAALRGDLGPGQRDWPDPMVHGPAAAARLAEDGVDDEGLLRAIAWHTVGHPDLDELGQALYMADFLEPGREYESRTMAERRRRVPAALSEVLMDVAADRIARSLRKERPLLEPTVRFWNALIDGR